MTTSVKFLTTFIFSTLFVLILSPRCDAQQEKLTKNGSIRDKNHETLTSPAKVFQMGFFGLEPNQRYLGIWYYADPKTIVWVANRDNPVSSSSSSSFLTIENDGNLVVKDKSRTYFTTGLPSASGSASWTLKLEDTGNLILQDGSGKQMWSSFSFPTDTFLPGMYMEKAMKLTSWKTQNDPGSGSYVFQKDTVFGYNNYTIFYGKRLHWKSGFGLESNINPTKMPIAAIHLLSRSNTTKTLNNSRLVMGSSGEIQFYYWDLTLGKWFLNWSEPKDYCGKYSACGQNSYCDMSKKNEYNSFCNCVPGFDLIPDVVTSEKVCKRTAPICIGNDTNFLKMEIVKIDVTFETFMESKSELECKEKCLGLDCCQAYSYSAVGNEELARVGVPGGKQGCWIWYSGSQLVDLQLEDTGNLILQDGSGKQMWSSFSFPTDTFLPGMYMEKAMKLTSWKTQNDPGSGSYVFQKDTVFGYNNYTIFYGKRLHWKSGFGLESNINPTKMPIAAIHLLSRSNTTKTLNNSRLVMGSSGEIQFYYWDLTLGKWFLNWSEPKDYCGKYSACGQNSYCDMSKKNEYNSFCNCVPGFDLIPDVVTSEKVCKRTAPICIGNDTNFLKMEIVKIDVTFETFMESKSELECKEKCLGLDCCQAYSYSAVGNEELARVGVPGGKQGCWIWYSGSQLVDLQVSDGAGGRILSIRNPISKGAYFFLYF
ncbi:Apple-like protein [Artemisia annua]|uniref:Apple-like protein n=1 Tax=Artemisia annua TaxID=35608 RepID=A0A2U1KHM7_ARTAN|nr:Apple-like protein [Artemisia annua]